MTDVTYANDFDVTDFLALANHVWPRDYSITEAAVALSRTINIGAWDATRLVGGLTGFVAARPLVPPAARAT